MIANNMPLFNHSAHKFGLCFEIVANKEKCGGNLLFFKNVKYLSGISVFISCVKGQVYDLFISVVTVKRPVFVKFLLRNVSAGDFVLSV